MYLMSCTRRPERGNTLKTYYGRKLCSKYENAWRIEEPIMVIIPFPCRNKKYNKWSIDSSAVQHVHSTVNNMDQIR